MSVTVKSGAGSDLLTVDPTSKAARVTLYDTSGNPISYESGGAAIRVVQRPPVFGSLGAYSLGGKSGSLAATIGANSTLFSARWGDATRFALIERISISAFTLTTVTASVGTDFELMMARSFSASDTGGTSILPAANMNERRTNMGTTLFTDMRISSTAALGAGTRTVDTNAMRRSGFGICGTTAPVIWFKTDDVVLWDAYQGAGNFHPIVLAQNEGVLVRNGAAGPATGTWVFTLNIDWMEVDSYLA